MVQMAIMTLALLSGLVYVPSGDVDVSALSAAAAKASLTSRAPKDCDEAIFRALGRKSDGLAKSVSISKSGVLDACFGAMLIPGKKPSFNPGDYICWGREGIAEVSSEGVVAVTRVNTFVDREMCRIRVITKAPNGNSMLERPEVEEERPYLFMSDAEAVQLARDHLGIDIPPSISERIDNAFEDINKEQVALDKRIPEGINAEYQKLRRLAAERRFELADTEENKNLVKEFERGDISDDLRNSPSYQELVKSASGLNVLSESELNKFWENTVEIRDTQSPLLYTLLPRVQTTLGDLYPDEEKFGHFRISDNVEYPTWTEYAAARVEKTAINVADWWTDVTVSVSNAWKSFFNR